MQILTSHVLKAIQDVTFWDPSQQMADGLKFIYWSTSQIAHYFIYTLKQQLVFCIMQWIRDIPNNYMYLMAP